MLDLDPGLVLGAGHEADLDLGRIRAVAVEVPGVGQPGGWLPDRHLAPVMLDAVRLALEDPAAGPGEAETVWSSGHHSPIRPVHVSKACSTGQSSSNASRIGSIIAAGAGPCSWLPAGTGRWLRPRPARRTPGRPRRPHRGARRSGGSRWGARPPGP